MPDSARVQLPYGDGIFRRRFLLRALDGRVVGDMEDDFHRFHVDLFHDGHHVLEVRGQAGRYPWNTCAGAVEPLRALEGMALTGEANAGAEFTNPRINCTHLFDLACLAVSHAAAGRDRRLYDVAIPDYREGRTRAELHCDGQALLAWNIDGGQIEGPEPFAGLPLRGHFVPWVRENLAPEMAEAALVLRRSCFISMARARNLDEAPSAMSYMSLTSGSCHSFTPGIAEKAERVRGTIREFTHEPGGPLADLV